MAKVANRWGIQRTPEGGISIGWTTVNGFRRCMRRGFWSQLYGGKGLTLPPLPPDMPMLYGQLWHAGYRASAKGEDIKAGLLAHLALEGLSAEPFLMLVDEVMRDLDWYWQQSRGQDGTLKILACEEELRVRFGIHELRGTPDLVAETASGSVVIPDHKTYGVLSTTAKGAHRIELAPRDLAVVKYQTSRQFAFYAMLWNEQNPDKPCYDSMLNMVPSHVCQVLDILSTRVGDVAKPQVKRIHLQSFSEQYLNELRDSTVALCDLIHLSLDKQLDISDLSAFPENESACIGYRGSRCSFYDLCTDPDMRDPLIGDVFKLKED